MMDEAVDGGHDGCFVREHLVPFPEAEPVNDFETLTIAIY